MHFSIFQNIKTLAKDKQIITSLKKNRLGKVKKNVSIQNWKVKDNKSDKTVVLCCKTGVDGGSYGYATTVWEQNYDIDLVNSHISVGGRVYK